MRDLKQVVDYYEKDCISADEITRNNTKFLLTCANTLAAKISRCVPQVCNCTTYSYQGLFSQFVYNQQQSLTSLAWPIYYTVLNILSYNKKDINQVYYSNKYFKSM